MLDNWYPLFRGLGKACKNRLTRAKAAGFIVIFFGEMRRLH
jgi:hypothetical protein